MEKNCRRFRLSSDSKGEERLRGIISAKGNHRRKMRDLTEEERAAPCTCTSDECSGNCRQLVELLSLFRNTVKGNSDDNDDDINSEDQLREEIKQVLERKVKSKKDKIDINANQVNEHKEDETKSESMHENELGIEYAVVDEDTRMTNVEENDDVTLTSSYVRARGEPSEDKIRVLISEQLVDLKAQLHFPTVRRNWDDEDRIRELEHKVKELEADMKYERKRSSSLSKQAKENERRYQEVRTQLNNERETTERCQAIAKSMNTKLYRIRSLLEEAANKQNSVLWQRQLREVKEQLDMDESLHEQFESIASAYSYFPVRRASKSRKRTKTTTRTLSLETL